MKALLALIHPRSAWKRSSANFACTVFPEVHLTREGSWAETSLRDHSTYPSASHNRPKGIPP